MNFKRLGLLAGKAARALSALAQLTPARVDLLLAVLHHERPQHELAAVLCVSPSVVSRMVRVLLEAELLERRVDEQDRRVRRVRISAKGRARLEPCFGASPYIPRSGARSAQCAGEHMWLRDWRQPLEHHGVRIGSLVRAFRPPFLQMQWRNRANPYPDVLAMARYDEWVRGILQRAAEKLGAPSG